MQEFDSQDERLRKLEHHARKMDEEIERARGDISACKNADHVREISAEIELIWTRLNEWQSTVAFVWVLAIFALLLALAEAVAIWSLWRSS